MVTAAQQALFDNFGANAANSRVLSEINPPHADYPSQRAFKFSFSNGQLSVDCDGATPRQIRTLIEKANALGIGFKADGPERIGSLMSSDVKPEFLDTVSKGNPSPAAKAYRAERQLDGQAAAKGSDAAEAVESHRAKKNRSYG